MAALTTTSAVKAKRRAFSAVRTLGLSSSMAQALSIFFQEISQKKGNPDLQIVEFVPTANGTDDTVICSLASAFTFYGCILKGGATARAVRWADHDSSANTPTTLIPVGVGEQVAYLWPGGAAYTTGLTVDEAGSGGASGFFILGA